MRTSAGLRPADALLLLPRMPLTACVVGPPGSWPDALRWWDVEQVEGPAELCVVTGTTGSVPAHDLLLLDGVDPGSGVGGGPDLRRWVVLPGSDETVLAVPQSSAARLRATRLRRRARWRRPWRRDGSVGIGLLDGSALPAVLRSSHPGRAEQDHYLVVARDARRRAVFLPLPGGTAASVVKASRAPAESARAEREQVVQARLHELGLGGRVPEPQGSGQVGPVAWSRESASPGRAWALRPARPATERSTLEAVAEWLTQLAVATSSGAREIQGFPYGLPLRAPFLDVDVDPARLADVPAVLTHGDLASGRNVLLHDDAFSVIDWETADDRGLPLTDLLPLACWALARAAGCKDTCDEARYVLRLCQGVLPDSALLFTLVQRCLHACGVPLPVAGSLAGLAWARQASMRIVHQELLASAGLPVEEWSTAADAVAPAWRTTGGLGREWVALQEWAAARPRSDAGWR